MSIIILRTRQLCQKLAISNTTLFTKYLKDPTFPKPTKLGGTNAWHESDIDAWLIEQKEKQGVNV